VLLKRRDIRLDGSAIRVSGKAFSVVPSRRIATNRCGVRDREVLYRDAFSSVLRVTASTRVSQDSFSESTRCTRQRVQSNRDVIKSQGRNRRKGRGGSL